MAISICGYFIRFYFKTKFEYFTFCVIVYRNCCFSCIFFVNFMINTSDFFFTFFSTFRVLYQKLKLLIFLINISTYLSSYNLIDICTWNITLKIVSHLQIFFFNSDIFQKEIDRLFCLKCFVFVLIYFWCDKYFFIYFVIFKIILFGSTILVFDISELGLYAEEFM